MKKIILIFVVFLLFQFIDVNALDFKCEVKQSCSAAAGENTIFYMYNNVDTHISKTNTNWPYKLCCSDDISNSCSASLNTQLFKLYLSKDGHVSRDNTNYPDTVCFSSTTATTSTQGSIACNLRSSCASGEQCVITLSNSDDAHVSDCNAKDAQGRDISYSNKLCCGVTVCPGGFGWDQELNNGQGGCRPTGATCYVGDIGSLTADSGSLCKDKWRPPVKQSDPYWEDATNSNTLDCFVTSNNINARACCFLPPAQNTKEYGIYRDVVVKKVAL